MTHWVNEKFYSFRKFCCLLLFFQREFYSIFFSSKILCLKIKKLLFLFSYTKIRMIKQLKLIWTNLEALCSMNNISEFRKILKNFNNEIKTNIFYLNSFFIKLFFFFFIVIINTYYVIWGRIQSSNIIQPTVFNILFIPIL